MLNASKPATLAVIMLTSGALALRLENENASASTTASTNTNESTSTAASTDSTSVTTTAGPATATEWITFQNSSSRAGGSATFILNEDSADDSKVQFTSSIKGPTAPKNIKSEFCLDRPGESGLCIQWSYKRIGSENVPQLYNYVYACESYDYESGSCPRHSHDISMIQWQLQNGVWIEYFNSTTIDFHDCEILHDPDTGSYDYSVSIPIDLLPDQKDQTALENLSADNPVELNGNYVVWIDYQHVKNEAEFTVAPVANATLYSGSDCQGDYYSINYLEGTQNRYALDQFAMTSVRIQPGFFIQTKADWMEDREWLALYSQIQTDGKTLCWNLPADSDWYDASDVEVHPCRSWELNAGKCGGSDYAYVNADE